MAFLAYLPLRTQGKRFLLEDFPNLLDNHENKPHTNKQTNEQTNKQTNN